MQKRIQIKIYIKNIKPFINPEYIVKIYFKIKKCKEISFDQFFEFSGIF